ncbi:MAG: hypothetical protein ACE366_19310 [Bradymonadia bacterium]
MRALNLTLSLALLCGLSATGLSGCIQDSRLDEGNTTASGGGGESEMPCRPGAFLACPSGFDQVDACPVDADCVVETDACGEQLICAPTFPGNERPNPDAGLAAPPPEDPDAEVVAMPQPEEDGGLGNEGGIDAEVADAEPPENQCGPQCPEGTEAAPFCPIAGECSEGVNTCTGAPVICVDPEGCSMDPQPLGCPRDWREVESCSPNRTCATVRACDRPITCERQDFCPLACPEGFEQAEAGAEFDPNVVGFSVEGCGEQISCLASLDCDREETPEELCPEGFVPSENGLCPIGVPCVRAMGPCGGQTACTQIPNCDVPPRCLDGWEEVEVCLDDRPCVLLDICGEQLLCSVAEVVCDAEPVCPDDTATVTVCPANSECEQRSICGAEKICARW